MGPQGSGKTTQAKLLAKVLKVPLISTGDVLRQISRQSSFLGRRIKTALDQGKLADDQLVAEVVAERVSQADCQNGFVMDGYPRSITQLKLFDPQFDRIFYLDISGNQVIDRLLKRGREDDTPKLITERLKFYHQLSEPLIGLFGEKGILQRVDGTGSIYKIQSEIRSSLKIQNG